jgi:hypothetical protein
MFGSGNRDSGLYDRPIASRRGASPDFSPRLDIAPPRRDPAAPTGGRPMPVPAHASGHNLLEPDILDEDLRPDDIAFVLKHLRFGRGDLATVKIDRGTRDYLVRALRR